MVEVEVRVGDRDDVGRVDPAVPQQGRQVVDGRPEGRLDLVAAEPDPGIEQDDAVGVDDRVAHHEPGPSGEVAADRVHEVGDVEGLDPDRGRV